MKKMQGFRVMAVFVVGLSLISVALTGCDYVNEFLGGIGLGGGVEGNPEAVPEDPAPTDRMADGGETTFIKVDDVWYEVHTFSTDMPPTRSGEQAEGTLSFNWKPADETVEVLVVAGGGGGGAGTGNKGNTSSGGGAGRFVYHPAFKVGDGEEWGTAGTITVKVGAGGEAGTISGQDGSNGGDSEFVRHTDYQIIAKGGGAGAGNGNTARRGLNGGSGGGSHWGVDANTTQQLAGTVPAEAGVLNLGSGGHHITGGGAGEDGAVENYGVGRQSAISGELKWYSAGGWLYSTDAENGTGSGGSGVNGAIAGTNGGSGIVIARWPYVASAP